LRACRLISPLCWILPAALAVGAAKADTPVLSQVTGGLDGPCLRLSFFVDVGGANSRAGMYLGTDPDPSDETTTQRVRVRNNNKSRTTSTCTLPANRRTYVQPFSTDAENQDEGRLQCGEICTNCNFGAGPTPLSCDGPGEAPFVDMGPSEGIQTPALPVHSFDPNVEPTINGQTFRVACVDGLAADFGQKLSEAMGADGGLWHKLEVPSGCTVREHVNVPHRASNGPGGVVITTAGDPRLFPPSGVRIDPSYRGKLARFEAPSDWATGGLGVAALRSKDGLQGVRFQNIEIAPPPHESVPVQQLNVTGVEVDGRRVSLIMDEPPGGLPGHRRVMLDIKGCQGLRGMAVVLRVRGTQVQLQGGFDVKGVCTGGTLTQAISYKIESCSPGDPVICRTSEPHGLPHLERLPIASIADAGDGTSTATLAAPMHRIEGNGTHYVIGGDVVRLEGTGTALDGKFTRARGNALEAIRLDGSANCAESCGSLHEIHPIQIFETGVPGLDGVRHFVPVDERTIEVYGAELSDTVSQGFLAYDPGTLASYSFRDAKRLVFDRILLDCGSFPYRTSICLNMNGAEASAVVNSYIRGRSYWLPMDPLTLTPGSAWDGNRSLAPASPTLYVSDAIDFQLLNTTIYDTHGITILSERFDRVAEDHTVRRVTVHKPKRFIAGHPQSDGRYYQDRHCWETKSGRRMLLEGIRCSGNWADWTPLGPAILFSPRGRFDNGEPVVASDLTVRGSIIDRTASGIMIAGDGIGKAVGPAQRVLITNNLFQEIDFFEHRSIISGVNGLHPSTNFGGAVMILASTVASLQFTRNTVGIQRGKSTALMHVMSRNGSMFKIEDNVLNFSRGGSGVFGITTEGTGCGGGTSGAARFSCLVGRGGQRDPDTTFDGNVIYGCSRNGDSSDEARFDASLQSLESSVSAQEAEAYYAGIHSTRENDFLADLGPASCGQRLDAVFEPGGFTPRPEFAGKGADMDLLAVYQGEVGPVAVEQPSATSVSFRYRAPDDAACQLDYSTDASFSIPDLTTRVSDGGGERDRSVTIEGLAPETGYAYRLLCAAQQPRGVFTTGP